MEIHYIFQVFKKSRVTASFPLTHDRNIFKFFSVFIFGCAGLHCCTGFPLIAESWGSSLVAVHGLSLW